MRKTIEFNSGWEFYKGDLPKESSDSVAWEGISLPHTYNALDGQDGGNDYYQGCAWYRKKFT